MNIVTFLHKVSQVIINPFIRLLFLVALVVFLWGVFNAIKGSANDAKRQDGKTQMFWGIIGMFIMISVYGILNLIIGTVGVDGQTQTQIDQVIKR